MNYRHAGDFGDIIYFLPVIEHHGRGVLYIENAPVGFTRQQLTPEAFAPLVPLLKAQPYIEDVLPFKHGQQIDINGNDFRLYYCGHRHLQEATLLTHGVSIQAKFTKWLVVDPKPVAKVVINKTLRYHNPRFPWKRALELYGQDCVFIGHRSEHEGFCKVFGDVPFYQTSDLLEAARVIAGSQLFIGNQSVCYAIAEGMKHDVIQEVYPPCPNCIFNRSGAIHGHDENVPFPVLKYT